MSSLIDATKRFTEAESSVSDEALPYQIVNAVKSEIRKRETLNW